MVTTGLLVVAQTKRTSRRCFDELVLERGVKSSSKCDVMARRMSRSPLAFENRSCRVLNGPMEFTLVGRSDATTIRRAPGDIESTATPRSLARSMGRPANSYTISFGLSPALSAIAPGVTEMMPAPLKLEDDTASAPKIVGRCVTSSGPTHNTIALADSRNNGIPLCLAPKMKAFLPCAAQDSLAFFSTICVAQPDTKSVSKPKAKICFIRNTGGTQRVKRVVRCGSG